MMFYVVSLTVVFLGRSWFLREQWLRGYAIAAAVAHALRRRSGCYQTVTTTLCHFVGAVAHAGQFCCDVFKTACAIAQVDV